MFISLLNVRLFPLTSVVSRLSYGSFIRQTRPWNLVEEANDVYLVTSDINS